MNKRKIYLIALLLCGIMIFLICSNDEKQEYYMWEESGDPYVLDEDERWITREYLIENEIFTSEEIAKTDVDKIAKKWRLVEGDEKEERFWSVFNNYKDVYWLPQYCIFYNYLDEEAVYPWGRQWKKAEGKIITLGFKESAGMESCTMVFDFQKGCAYYGDLQSVISDTKIPRETIELSDKQIEKINQLLSDNNFFEWNSLYVDWNVDFSDAPDSNFSWNFYVELENGKIYKIYGSQDAPDTYGEVRDGLEKYFKGAKGYPW